MTEFARGGSLHAVLYKQKRVLDTQRKVEIAIDVASGMNYLHSLENPIIHRDLNPHNILLNEKGQALVADFGESRLLIKMSSGMDEMTKQTGNLRYMAPEVFGTNGAYSEKADVFSYGLCLWELFAEATPFEDVLAAAAAAEMAYNDLRPYVPPSWPRELTVLIASCWHVTPSNRPAFSEILKTLQTELRGLSAPVATLASEPDPNELVGSRNGSLRLRSNSVRSDTANSSDYVEVRKVRPTLRLASTDRRPFSWVRVYTATFCIDVSFAEHCQRGAQRRCGRWRRRGQSCSCVILAYSRPPVYFFRTIVFHSNSDRKKISEREKKNFQPLFEIPAKTS